MRADIDNYFSDLFIPLTNIKIELQNLKEILEEDYIMKLIFYSFYNRSMSYKLVLENWSFFK